MEYTYENFRAQEFTHAPSGECGLEMIGNAEICADVEAMSQWYQQVLDLRVLEEFRDAGDHVVVLSDKDYEPDARRSLFLLQNARTDFEKQHMAEHGPYISAIIYQAKNVQRAFEDGLWAGMVELQKPARDALTGLVTAYLREPCGSNVIMLTEHYAPGASGAMAA
jgi:4-hydroxyphenylpyruvate dioxygenase-like putative hemolysin